MGSSYPSLDGYIADFVRAQPMFFVATAAEHGHVNVSPKGGTGSLIVVDSETVAYLDLTGSGIETVSHVRHNGRITLMWCAFTGAPNIVRVYGTARVVSQADPDWADWRARFPANPGARAVIVVTAERITDSCGMAVPRMEYVEDRTDLDRWATSKGPAGLRDYRGRKNAESIDGIPGLAASEY